MSSEGLAANTVPDSPSPDEHPRSDPARLSGRGVFVIAALVVVSFGVASALNYVPGTSDEGARFGNGVHFVLSLMIPTMAALFGVYWLRGLIRDAIAVSVFVAYFAVLFHFVTFDFNLRGDTANALLTNFTTLTGVVAAFYFGSIAAVEVAKQLYPAGRQTSGPDK